MPETTTTDRRTVPHAPSAECATEHCHYHHIDEPGEGAYLVCLECGHVYATADDLLAAYREAWEPAPTVNADDAHTCPLCAHSF